MSSVINLPMAVVPYAVCLLFLLFMGIVLAWETLLGLLGYMSDFVLPQLRRVLVDRLKDELLALGVVSLILSFMEKVGRATMGSRATMHSHGEVAHSNVPIPLLLLLPAPCPAVPASVA